jgi:hypothetical protein
MNSLPKPPTPLARMLSLTGFHLQGLAPIQHMYPPVSASGTAIVLQPGYVASFPRASEALKNVRNRSARRIYTHPCVTFLLSVNTQSVRLQIVD